MSLLFQAHWVGNDDKDFNQTIVLEEIKRVLSRPGMAGKQSVFFFNVGIHYSLVLNFTTYQRLIENVIALLRQGTGKKSNKTLSSQALLIWRSSTAIEREKLRKSYPDDDNLTKGRFHTSPVRSAISIFI